MDEGFLADIKIVEQMDSDMIRRYVNLRKSASHKN